MSIHQIEAKFYKIKIHNLLQQFKANYDRFLIEGKDFIDSYNEIALRYVKLYEEIENRPNLDYWRISPHTNIYENNISYINKIEKLVADCDEYLILNVDAYNNLNEICDNKQIEIQIQLYKTHAEILNNKIEVLKNIVEAFKSVNQPKFIKYKEKNEYDVTGSIIGGALMTIVIIGVILCFL